MKEPTTSGHDGRSKPAENEVVESPGVTLRRCHSLSDLRNVSFSQQVGGNANDPLEGKSLHRPPPPPLENDRVRHPYTSPGAIRIQPQIQLPTIRPHLDREAPSAPHSEILIEARLVEEETSATTERTHDDHAVVEAMPVVPAKKVYIDEYNDNRQWCGRRRSNGQRLLVVVIVVLLGIIGLGLGLWLHSESGEVHVGEADDATPPANNTTTNEAETEGSNTEIDDERDFPKL
jgi:hypothetical protein